MISPNILIVTNAADYHALVVSEALRRKGAPHSLWYAGDFPSLQRASAWFENGNEKWAVEGPEISLSSSAKTSTVWLRRPGRPLMPEGLHPADISFAYRECHTFLGGLRRVAGSEAFWVNPPEGFARANFKIEQLRSALRSGLAIPETLMSNDPGQIRSFVKGKAGNVVYKAFFPYSWMSSDGLSTLFCSPVEESDLPEDSVLVATPGIFQSVMKKAYELRVTALGQRLFAVKINSQRIPSAVIDWRAATEPVPLEPYVLPASLEHALLSVMKNLGIVFGCFDLVVTPEGDYIFLEVNEMGAFLWLEEELPELHLVDSFCEFLCQGREDFQVNSKRPRVTLAEVHDDAVRRMESSTSCHVKEPAEFSIESS